MFPRSSLATVAPSYSWEALPQRPSAVLLRSSLLTTEPFSVHYSSSNYLVRIVFLRALAFVSWMAFWIAFRQNKALIGDNGITPARWILQQAESRGKIKQERRLQWREQFATSRKKRSVDRRRRRGITLDHALWNVIGQSLPYKWIMRFIDRFPMTLKLREVLWDRTDAMDRPLPCLLWLTPADRRRINPWLDGIALTRLTLSTVVFILGAANVPIMLMMWLCQRSLVSVGGVWYAYGWEPQLAELLFHAIFLVPLLSLRPIPTSFPIPSLVQWLIKWHLFRVMMGAGLIKFRSGDPKWRDLTTMNYFYETQPIPNPLSRYYHNMPVIWHKFEVLVNHFVEVVAPWLLILPCLPVRLRRFGGLLQMAFQSVLISCGNLSFLNWLTMVPAIMCLDDALLAPLFKTSFMAMPILGQQTPCPLVRQVVTVAFFLVMAQLSVPVIRNLCSSKQIMNGSFDPLRLVNTYGAFGTVQETREEYIIKGSSDLETWKEYEFRAKPGNVYSRPPFVSPYHFRLDWQMWIAACQGSTIMSPWMYCFLLKLLEQDPGVMKLLKDDPFAGSQDKPKYIRIVKYQFEFNDSSSKEISDATRSTKRPFRRRQETGRVYPRKGVATKESLLKEISVHFPQDPEKEVDS